MLSNRDQLALYKRVCALAVEAGDLLKRGFSRRVAVSYKGRIDPVTEVDLASERFIVEKINGAYPDHDILTEEDTIKRKRASRFRWIIDPLDGTVNFAHGFPIYCVSIAVEYDGEVIAGAVCDPERGELFHAARGRGAYLNKQRLHISREKNLERALLATGFAYDIGTSRRNNLGYFARMAKQAQGIRRPGSAAIDLCWVAAGRLDGFWELKLHPWDTAAAVLILKEAGGKYSRVNGKPYAITDPDLLATNGHLHDPMRRVLTGKYRGTNRK
ncbi:MAG: inositol monophosphatase [candidate division Zixibacteria bacterium]|nr:inositol monophosphatase [candidate division Zixibacteria bacterium]